MGLIDVFKKIKKNCERSLEELEDLKEEQNNWGKDGEKIITNLGASQTTMLPSPMNLGFVASGVKKGSILVEHQSKIDEHNEQEKVKETMKKIVSDIGKI